MLQSQHNLPPPPAAPQSGRAAAFSQQDQQQDQEPPVSGSTPAGNSSLRSSFSAITPSTPRVTFNPVNKIQYFTPASSASSSDLSSASPALSSASSSASSASSSASSGSSQQGPVNLGYGLYIDPDKEGVFSGVNTSSESVRHHGFRRPASVPSLSLADFPLEDVYFLLLPLTVPLPPLVQQENNINNSNKTHIVISK